MKVDKKYLDYLNGSKFIVSCNFEIKENFYPSSRIDKIIELTGGRKVIHVGCCDHIPIIKDKIREKTWLHGLLTENCSEVLGIDIDKKAIEYVQEEIGYSNVMYFNLLGEINDKIVDKKWDYMILGEILEHTNNPVEFLESIVNKYKDYVKQIIITVPNIYCISKILQGIKYNGELINSDHRYWFTPYTLVKVGVEAGLKEPNLYFADLKAYKKKKFIIRRKIEKVLKKQIFKYNFYEFETLILVANLK